MQGVRFGEIEMAGLEKSAKNEKLGSSLVFQYMNSIVFNLSGIIFYVYIVKFYPTDRKSVV